MAQRLLSVRMAGLTSSWRLQRLGSHLRLVLGLSPMQWSLRLARLQSERLMGVVEHCWQATF